MVKDSYNHIYPWFNTLEQYPKDMVIPNYNSLFYQPIRKIIHYERLSGLMFISILLVMDGWPLVLRQYIRTFWRVVGLDSTVGSIIEKFKTWLFMLWIYAMLVNNNGNIMAAV